jgi:hypothetical protein
MARVQAFPRHLLACSQTYERVLRNCARFCVYMHDYVHKNEVVTNVKSDVTVVHYLCRALGKIRGEKNKE